MGLWCLTYRSLFKAQFGTETDITRRLAYRHVHGLFVQPQNILKNNNIHWDGFDQILKRAWRINTKINSIYNTNRLTKEFEYQKMYWV